MKVGFGIDIAGFSNPLGTVVAAIAPHGRTAEVTILTNSPFNKKNSELQVRIVEEADFLNRLLDLGSVAVDVPIDLQGLPARDAKWTWGLTYRPIDNKLRALPPLASLLGACVVRFSTIMSSKTWMKLGSELFETYPAACLARMFGRDDSDVKSYKKNKKEQREQAAKARFSLAERLGIKIDNPKSLTHDELDAIICAIVSVAAPEQILPSENFGLGDGYTVPKGYRLIERNPFQQISCSRLDYSEWKDTVH